MKMKMWIWKIRVSFISNCTIYRHRIAVHLAHCDFPILHLGDHDAVRISIHFRDVDFNGVIIERFHEFLAIALLRPLFVADAIPLRKQISTATQHQQRRNEPPP